MFSPRKIDDGTLLLFNTVLNRTYPVDVVADVGVGYGPLAIGLVRAGLASQAVASDVDCIALWLAELNANRAGVSVTLKCTPSPMAVPMTPLTVCNVPTHIDTLASKRLMHQLLGRAVDARLQFVVHTSLEQRYAHYIRERRMAFTTDRNATHVVFTVDG